MVFLIRKLLSIFPVTLAVTFLVGMMIHLIPGDPVEIIAGDFATETNKAEIRKQLGLDKPILTQIGSYYSHLATGNFGTSLINQQPVLDLILERTLPTFELASLSVLFSVLLCIPLGAACAIWPTSALNWFCSGITLVGISMPNFWLGPLLILFFSIHLGWFPVSGRTNLVSLILPILALSSSLTGLLFRTVKINFSNQLKEDYVRTARSKGLSETVIFFKHILKNASISIVTLVSIQFGALVTGTIITEKVFDWPGLGTLIAEAIEQRDYPVIQGCVFLFSLSFLVISIVTDLIYSSIDPRIQLNR